MHLLLNTASSLSRIRIHFKPPLRQNGLWLLGVFRFVWDGTGNESRWQICITMPLHTFYAYVDGSDLYDIADLLMSRISDFISSREWKCPNVQLINQRLQEDDPSLGPDDLPDWQLGINMDLPDPGSDIFGWSEDIGATIEFLTDLHRETNREFVVGTFEHKSGNSIDMFFIPYGKHS